MKLIQVVLVLCCLCSLISAQDKGKGANKILRLEDQWREAQKRSDQDAFERLLSPDVTFIGTSGSFRDKKGFMGSRSGSWIPRADTFTQSDISLRFYGHVAIVTGVESTTGAEVTNRARFTHVWAKRGARWLLVAIQRTDIVNP